MKKKPHSDEQIVKILREANETTVAATARSHGITEQTIYRWRRLYDGMQVNDIEELNALRDENQRLKKLLAERDLEVDIMKEINAKNASPTGPTRNGASGLSAWGYRLAGSALRLREGGASMTSRSIVYGACWGSLYRHTNPAARFVKGKSWTCWL